MSNTSESKYESNSESKNDTSKNNHELSYEGRSFVRNRFGDLEQVRFDRITDRIDTMCSDLYGRTLTSIDAPLITQQVISGFRSGMSTHELDMLVVNICSNYASHHPDYEDLASRITVSDLQKSTPNTFKYALINLFNAIDSNGVDRSRLNPLFRSIMGLTVTDDGLTTESPVTVRKKSSVEALMGLIDPPVSSSPITTSDLIENKIDYSRDFNFRHFGLETLKRSYLMKHGVTNAIAERPQHMYMRVSLGVHVLPFMSENMKNSDSDEYVSEFNIRLNDAFRMYDDLSLQRLSHASPTLFNAGSKRAQLSSCFQTATDDDLFELLETVKSVGLISKWSGGISVCLTPIRAQGSPITSTGGVATGIKHYIKILNDLQVYVNQGGLRKGAFALYLEIWHADVLTFLELPKRQGELAIQGNNAPDLKYALWVPDRFMRALEFDEDWYLMCPYESPNLYKVHGEEFEILYQSYIDAGKYRKIIKARDLFREYVTTVSETGFPYWSNKDNANRKSNMRNVATITSSNLCNEIYIPNWTNFRDSNRNILEKGQFGVCNLAAICLGTFLGRDAENNPTLDFQGIIDTSYNAAINLDRVIDANFYPTEECRTSNKQHRPIGVGILGLADVFAHFKYIFGEARSMKLDQAIAACVYYGAMKASVEQSRKYGTYSSYGKFNHYNSPSLSNEEKAIIDERWPKPPVEVSPISEGRLQPDLWAEYGNLDCEWQYYVSESTNGIITPNMWEDLRNDCRTVGVRNSYVTAYMPTASTSNIVGQNECFEPFTSNIYTRKTLAGEFIIINRYLMDELIASGQWSGALRRKLIQEGGSIQNMDLDPELKSRFMTARELDYRAITMHAASRAPFICQGMSLNYYFTDVTIKKMITVQIMGWKMGLKTGSYYIHSSPMVGAAKTSVMEVRKKVNTPAITIAINSVDDCSACSV